MKKIMLSFLLLLAATFSFGQNVPSYVPTNGLVGWWPFNGNANDESGNGNNGTVNGATLTTDRFGNVGNAYDFDGVNDGITVNNTLLSNTPVSYSVNFWCKLDTTLPTANGYTIFDDCDSSQWYGKGRFVARASQYNNPSFNFRENYGIMSEDTNPSFYTWVNYCCVLNTNNGKFYLYKNSNLVDSAVFASSYYRSGNRKTQIGRTQTPIRYNGIDYFTGHWKGKIDDIGIWNRALSQQEITNLYNGNICYQTISVTDTLYINTNITGFNPVTYENSIRIWPNPTNDHITIDAGNLNVMNGYSIRITNSLGQQMFQSAINQQQFYLDLTTWTGNGMYYVNIIDPNGNIIDIKKIVLQ